MSFFEETRKPPNSQIANLSLSYLCQLHVRYAKFTTPGDLFKLEQITVNHICPEKF